MKTSAIAALAVAFGLTSCATRDYEPSRCFTVRHEAYADMVRDDLRSGLPAPATAASVPYSAMILKHANRAHAAACAALAVLCVEARDLDAADTCISQAIVMDPSQMEYAAMKIVLLRCKGHDDVADDLADQLGAGVCTPYVQAMLGAVSRASIPERADALLRPCEKSYVEYLRRLMPQVQPR